MHSDRYCHRVSRIFVVAILTPPPPNASGLQQGLYILSARIHNAIMLCNDNAKTENEFTTAITRTHNSVFDVNL